MILFQKIKLFKTWYIFLEKFGIVIGDVTSIIIHLKFNLFNYLNFKYLWF